MQRPFEPARDGLRLQGGARIETRRGYQEGSRHVPAFFLRVVISTADSAINMMTTVKAARPPFVDDDCAAGAGAARCCGSS